MISPDETFDGTFPFAPHFSSVNGFRMHYVDEGRGNPILCLHGEPTWSYLFRQIIPLLSVRNRVIVPDHMGFGKSDTPPDRQYSLEAHVSNLENLVLELDLHEITLVIHDWGGPIGSGLALRHPDRIARLVVTNTPITLGLPHEGELLMKNTLESGYFRWMAKLYQEGTLETILGNFGTIILGVMKGLQGFEQMTNVTDSWLNAYSSPSPRHKSVWGLSAFRAVLLRQVTTVLRRHRPAALQRYKPNPLS